MSLRTRPLLKMRQSLTLILTPILVSISVFISVFFVVDRSEAQQTCEGLFTPDHKANAEALFENARTGKTIIGRGFISGRPGLSPEIAKYTGQLGMMWWSARIYVVDSITEAKKHATIETDPLVQGLYLVRSEKAIRESGLSREQVADLSATEAFNRFYPDGKLIYLDHGMIDMILKGDEATYWKIQKLELPMPEPKIVEIPQSFVAENFTVTDSKSDVQWEKSDNSVGPFIVQAGWTFPQIRGVITMEDASKSTTYKDRRKDARSLFKRGFSITFNKDFEGALKMVRDQERLVTTPPPAGAPAGTAPTKTWVANSRYKEQALFDEALQAFRDGRAFSVEVRNEKGQLVGGIIGNISGKGFYSPDSTFYDKDNYPKETILFSKIAVLALKDRLQKAGIPFIDAGMVTPFTATMKGKLIPAQQFLEMIAALPKDADPDLTTNWTPDEYTEVLN